MWNYWEFIRFTFVFEYDHLHYWLKYTYLLFTLNHCNGTLSCLVILDMAELIFLLLFLPFLSHFFAFYFCEHIVHRVLAYSILSTETPAISESAFGKFENTFYCYIYVLRWIFFDLLQFMSLALQNFLYNVIELVAKNTLVLRFSF